jgi:hypothetical protein
VETKIFTKIRAKISLFFSKFFVFAKILYNFPENFCENKNFRENNKNFFFANILTKISYIFRENFLKKEKTLIFAKIYISTLGGRVPDFQIPNQTVTNTCGPEVYSTID